MVGRSNWKGHLRLSLVSCSVALYPAAGYTGRLKCHTINRKTGNRINEEVVDSVTREPVPREDRVKGCEAAKDEYVAVEESELERAVQKHSWENIPEEEKGGGKFHRKATPGGWREDLTPEQARIVEGITAPLLEELYPRVMQSEGRL